MEEKQVSQLVDELEMIKRLLILNTLKSGADQTEVAKVLRITDRQVRNILAGKA